MSIRKTTVALQRTSWAISVLLLMPTAVVQTAKDPSDCHLTALVLTAVWTAAMGAAYRRAVRKWMEDDE